MKEMKVESLSPGDTLFEDLRKAVGEQVKHNSIDYNTIAVKYNALPLGGILLVNFNKKVSIGNLARVLEGRGAVRGRDYNIVLVKDSTDGSRIPIGKRPIAIERLSRLDMLVRQL